MTRKLPARPDMWQPHEDGVIRELFPPFGATGVHEKLPKRTIGGIRTRASVLGITSTYSKVTPLELDIDSDEVHHLKIALRNMLDAYTRLTMILPKRTLAHAYILEAFGKTPELARRMME